jgi:transcriptional regulator with XRE-family HTH domain
MEASLPTKDGDINKRIGEIRKALGMRQDEFAEAIKVSRSYIGALETSHREINDRIIELICVNCGANEKWLREGTGKMFKDKHNPRLDRFMRNIEKLDYYLQEYVIKQLDILVECQEKGRLNKSQ